MGCFVVAEFLLTSASRGPSAIAEPLVETTKENTTQNMHGLVYSNRITGTHFKIGLSWFPSKITFIFFLFQTFCSNTSV